MKHHCGVRRDEDTHWSTLWPLMKRDFILLFSDMMKDVNEEKLWDAVAILLAAAFQPVRRHRHRGVTFLPNNRRAEVGDLLRTLQHEHDKISPEKINHVCAASFSGSCLMRLKRFRQTGINFKATSDRILLQVRAFSRRCNCQRSHVCSWILYSMFYLSRV